MEIGGCNSPSRGVAQVPFLKSYHVTSRSEGSSPNASPFNPSSRPLSSTSCYSTRKNRDARYRMAKDVIQKGTTPGPGNPGNNPSNAGPPPSTLAAQLVEDISASTKSSKSDENTELKGLFAIIQRVKDDPQLLKTSEERVEHNHMLIYVYVRVVLDGIKFDDPFFDRAHVRTEVLKAINFLRFTIKETPAVLDYRVAEGKLMFRGVEPLWVWLLPQLLRFLGHPQCVELGDSIEGLIQYFLLVIAQTASLWELGPLVMRYLRMSCQSMSSRQQLNPS